VLGLNIELIRLIKKIINNKNILGWDLDLRSNLDTNNGLL